MSRGGGKALNEDLEMGASWSRRNSQRNGGSIGAGFEMAQRPVVMGLGLGMGI